MNRRITFYPYVEFHKLFNVLGASRGDICRVDQILSEYFGKTVILLNSARTGIYLVLAAYDLHRSDEILIPPFLSQCVLNAITHATFPSLQASKKAKAMLVFHQFGYPQKIEELLPFAKEHSLLVVEDCAHSFASTYQGKKVGSFGDAAVFSFPKVLPTLLGGCLVTEDEKIIQFAREYQKEQNSLGWKIFSTLSLFPTVLVYGTGNGRVNKLVTHWLEICYSQFIYFPNPNKRVCHLFPRTKTELEETFDVRKRNLEIFRRYFVRKGYCQDLESDSGVVPFLVPYFDDVERLRKIVGVLKEIGVETGIYHFDVNRNILNSDYQKCVPIPVHQGISEEMMKTICHTIATV